jgi:Flp pilus assembly protein TadD
VEDFSMRLLSTILFGSLAAGLVGQQSASPFRPTNFGLVYQIPGMKEVAVKANVPFKGELKADFYYPAGHKTGDKLPVVVFCNGVGSRGPEGLKDWAIYKDWGRLLAAKGFLGVNYESSQDKTREDLADLMKFLASEKGAGLDADGSRMALWSCSANVGTALPYLMDASAAGIKCAVVYYGSAPVERFRENLPIQYVKAEFDGNFGIDELWRRAVQARAPWSLVLAKGLPHAFDAFENSDASRAMVAQTLEFLASHLQPLPPALPDTDARKVMSAFYGQQPLKALPILEKMHSENPTDREIRVRLLDCYERANQLEKAASVGDKLIKEDPKDAFSYSLLGKVFFKQKQYAQSAAASAKALELGMDSPMLRNGLGLAYLYMNENSKAIEVLEPLATRNTAFAIGHYNLACAYARTGQKEKALAALSKSIELGYTDWRAIEQDEDMKPLREEAGYKALIGRLKTALSGR